MIPTARRLARVRLLPDRSCDRAVVAIDVRPGSPRYVVRGWDGAPEGLAAAAAALRARLVERLAPRDRAALEVEVGVVELEGPAGIRRDDYALALAADAPLLLAAGWDGPAPGPFSAEHPAALPAAELPVVLRPSAVLSLATAWLEVTPPNEVAAALAGTLGVELTGASPYPPDDFPFDDDPAAPRLLARLEHWRFAFDGISDVRRRNLRLAARAVPQPPAEPYLALDVLRAHAASHRSTIPWRATWSVRSAGAVLAGAAPLMLQLDPALLRCARPAGAAEPACDRDPIQGDLWGWAPPLVLAARAGELLEHRS